MAPVPGRQGGLAFDLLRAETLKSNRLKPSVVQFNTPAEAIRRVSGDEGGIAVLLQPPPEDSGLKVVLVSREDQGVAYPPTPDNLHNGRLPVAPAGLSGRPQGRHQQPQPAAAFPARRGSPPALGAGRPPRNSPSSGHLFI
ncbi:MAG: hypothetical protein ABII82_11020 [Verrucomicrobiota bacterium]